ncbi:MAG: hypothetical protein LBO09_03365 [Candidatus Peribacteria bacterium]|nr:hypothetical protein [Candidatus Peribacteria bacterium]
MKVVETESGALVEEFEIEKVWVIDEGFDEEYYERIDESVRKFLEVGDGEEEVEDNEGTIST